MIQLNFNNLKFNNKQRYIIAFSGGIDSRVLLDLAARDLKGAEITAVHINHNLSANAVAWAQFCAQTCAEYKIDLEVHAVQLNLNNGDSVEAAARALRYQVFAQIMQPGDVLVLAQHADDQAETLLLQLLRGAGPRGLSGMAERSKFAAGEIWRPMLHLRRSQIVDYATVNNLRWIEDESNANRKYDRNFLRHEILPLLNKRWPEATTTINRAAHWCQQTEDLLQTEAMRRLQQAPGFPEKLALSVLRSEEPRWQSLLFRQWLTVRNALMPSQKKCATILQSFLTASPDAMPHEHWGSWQLQRYQDQLYLVTTADLQLGFGEWPLQPDVACVLPHNIGSVTGEMRQGAGIALQRLNGPLLVKFRNLGERCQPVGRAHSQTLKKLLQAAGVPPWQRGRIPMIYAGDQLVAVVGLWICAPFAAAEDEMGWVPVINSLG